MALNFRLFDMKWLKQSEHLIQEKTSHDLFINKDFCLHKTAWKDWDFPERAGLKPVSWYSIKQRYYSILVSSWLSVIQFPQTSPFSFKAHTRFCTSTVWAVAIATPCCASILYHCFLPFFRFTGAIDKSLPLAQFLFKSIA